jgi:peptidyl-prolyl cis-trans isomerase B (cyclophilin B)
MSGQNPQVLLETSKGNIKVELFKEKAPITVKNFLTYVKDGHYDGLIFHRVIKDFMIQGGGMNENLEVKKPRFAIKNEANNGLLNKRGTLAMARTAMVDSATCQFFINTVDNAFLDHQGKQPDRFGYCVFGQVLEGLEVVDQIREVKTGNKGGHSDVPIDSVHILTARLIEQEV